MQMKIFHLRLLPCLILAFVLLFSSFSSVQPVAIENSRKSISTHGKVWPSDEIPFRLKKYKNILSNNGVSLDCQNKDMFRSLAQQVRKTLPPLAVTIFKILDELRTTVHWGVSEYSEQEVAENPALGLDTFFLFRQFLAGLPEEEVEFLEQKYLKGTNLLLTIKNGFYDYVVESLKGLTMQPSPLTNGVNFFRPHTASMTRNQNVIEVRYFDFLSYFTSEDLAAIKDSEYRENLVKVLRKGKQYSGVYIDLQIYEAALNICDSQSASFNVVYELEPEYDR